MVTALAVTVAPVAGLVGALALRCTSPVPPASRCSEPPHEHDAISICCAATGFSPPWPVYDR